MEHREAIAGGSSDEESARRLAQRLAAGEDVSDDEFAVLLGPHKRRRSWPQVWIVVGSVIGVVGLAFLVWPAPGGLFDRILGMFMVMAGARLATSALRRISLKKAGVIR